MCDGAGQCIKTFVALRLGTGAAALSNAATPGFLEEYTLDGKLFAVPTNPVALPTTGNRLTFSGTATSEGGLSRSLDGKFITLAGYDADVGTASIANSPSNTTKRAIGRLDRAHSVDATTKLETAFSNNNVRSACSTDGVQLWAAGPGNAAAGGVWNTTLGSTGAGVQVVAAPTNVRTCHFYLGRFYAATSSGAFVSVFQTSDAIPTTAGQTSTTLTGLPTASGPSPYSFVVLDTNGDTTPDLIYIADDRTNGPGGVSKWTSADGVTWAAGTPANISLGANLGARGLAGDVQNGVVTLLASSTSAGANAIFKITDTLAGGEPPVVAEIVKTPASTVFRGVAMGTRLPPPGAAGQSTEAVGGPPPAASGPGFCTGLRPTTGERV